MMENQVDYLDREIMSELIANARIPFAQLAAKLRVSNSLIHQRVKKLKASGILKDPVYQVSPGALGYETCAFTQIIVVNGKLVPEVLEALKKIPEIVECSNIAGRYAIMVKIYAVNNSHLRDIIYDKIQPIPGIEGTNTVMSFETAFMRSVPLDVKRQK